MKNIKYLSLFVALIMGLVACEDKADTIFYPENVELGTLTAVNASYEITEENIDELKIDFKWSKADFGFNAAVTYDLEFTTKADNFVVIDSTFATTTDTEISISGRDILKQLLLFKTQFNMDITQAHDYAFRIKASISGDTAYYYNTINTSITGYELKEVDLPTEMYVQGSFAGWDWGSDKVISMIPVNGTPGVFWAITYFDANTDFKFCPVKAWNGDFGFPSSDAIVLNQEYQSGGDNGKIADAGFYLLLVKCTHTENKQDFTKAITVSTPIIQQMGDTSPQGWNIHADSNYSLEGDEFVSPAFVKDGEIRMFVNLKAFGISEYDWWKSEFIVLEGKIAYRGNGGDQARVQGTTGQVVKLNFKTGAGVIE